ncbi:hypothetical protein WM31_15745 [Burkholderia ubonensis]|nr:hypothetical protein WM31_15745 [Burkholderia ubonensis]
MLTTAQRPSLDTSIVYGATPLLRRVPLSVTLPSSTFSTATPCSSRSATSACAPSCVKLTPASRFLPIFRLPSSVTRVPSICSTDTPPSTSVTSASRPERSIAMPCGCAPSSMRVTAGGDALRSTTCRNVSKTSRFPAWS